MSRTSTGGVKLRRANKVLQFTVPDILPVKHLVGKDFLASYIAAGNRETITFSHIRADSLKTNELKVVTPIGPAVRKRRRISISLNDNSPYPDGFGANY